MIELTERSRRLLRSIYAGVGLGAAALSLQACTNGTSGSSWIMYGPGPAMYGPAPEYGPPYENELFSISGNVYAKGTDIPVSGIKVSVQGSSIHDYIGNNGYFQLYVPMQNSYTLIFEDFDGSENGSWKTHQIIVNRGNDYSTYLTIYLEETGK